MILGNMKKILLIVGTRPEAIKLAPIIHELQGDKSFYPLVCLTGQHMKKKGIWNFFNCKENA